MRAFSILLLVLLFSTRAEAQDEPQQQSGGVAEAAKHALELLFTKPIRISLEPIAATSGPVIGLAYKPKPWRSSTVFRIPSARVSVSTNKYWAAEGSLAFQGIGQREWRIEPYARFRSMKRLNHFGIGPASLATDRANFAMLDRRAGVYGYVRPAGWWAIGGRAEGLWPRTDNGEDPDLPSVELAFAPKDLAGHSENTNFVFVGVFLDLNYPYVRSERPRRGGDYSVSLGRYTDVSGDDHSFRRLAIEGQERFTVFGNDRLLTFHARLSSSVADSGHSVPFYLMETLGGADNLRGFKDAIIGGDEGTSTLRSFESYRFRDQANVLFQVDLRQRLWSQIFMSVFFDAGAVAPRLGDTSLNNLETGVGIGISVYRTNALALRAELSLRGGDTGRQHYFTTGRGIQFQ